MRRWAFLLGTCALAACRGEKPEDMKVCPRPRAAFDLHVSTLEASLPHSLVIKVGFGGAESESYSLRQGNSNNDVLCCADEDGVSLRPQTCGAALSLLEAAADGSVKDAAGANPMARDAATSDDATNGAANQGAEGSESKRIPSATIQCQVWTNGAAELSVSARGYTKIERTLVAKKDASFPQCDVWKTLSVEIPLEQGDASAP